MDTTELLQTQQIVSARLIEAALSVQVASKTTWRLRLMLHQQDYAWLCGEVKIARPLRATLSGHSTRGIIMHLSEQGTVSPDLAGTKVGFNGSVRDLHITENKVTISTVKAVLAEYNDGHRYLLVAPLPPQFLSTDTRAKLKARGIPQPAASIINAFQAAGEGALVELARAVQEMGGTGVAPIDLEILTGGVKQQPLAEPQPPVVETPEPPSTHSIVIAGSGVSTHPISTDSLRDLIEMVNEEVGRLREAGAEVTTRVDHNGDLRARVRVTLDTEF